MITSPQNERIRYLASLGRDGRLRREGRHFLVEGPRAVLAAMDSGARIEELIWSPNLAGEEHPLVRRAREAGTPVLPVSKDCYRKVADVQAPQGLAALVTMPEHRLDRVLAAPGGLFLLACGVQDPGNLGSMIRSADAAGAAGVVAIGPAADIYNGKTVRSTAGSILNIPVIRAEEGQALDALAASGVRLLAADPRGGQDALLADWRRPVALAVGAEAAGVSERVRAAAAGAVRIPMRGRAESLNAAAAAAVCLFAALWSLRGGDGPAPAG